MFRKLRAWWYRFTNKNQYLEGLKYAESAHETGNLGEAVRDADCDFDSDEFTRGIQDYWWYIRG